MKSNKKVKAKSNKSEVFDNKEEIKRRPIIKKEQLPDPIKLVWSAIIFFFIDYILFQKPLNDFLKWLLLVIPLTLLAISFSIWAYRKQFPFNSFPLDPIFAGNLINNEKNNIIHAVTGFVMCVFVIIIVTCNLIFP